ncbi:MAG: glycoside hydrolase family 92 protein, partial [Oscillospiraceae bacterium]|nr:glycoside hydrolase family 92 protein [Oscillospiraceae bacterium]
TTTGTGTGTVSAKSYTTVRKDLNIQVYPDTRLSYVINPQDGNSSSSYDFKLTSCHQAIDLKFTDGTRLKDLGAKDYFGFDMTPIGQGGARVYHVNSWNYVESNIGAVAAGKVIEEIIIGFEKPDSPRNIVVRAAYDDLKIFRRDDTTLIPSVELADFADVRFGTRVGDFGNGACSPLVGTPNPFNYWVPCTTSSSTTSPYNSQGRSINYIRSSHIASRWFSETGSMTFRPDATSTTQRTSASSFHKDNEIAHPYHYSVKFNDDDAVNPGVTFELTPMEHSAVFRFTFPAGSTNRSVQIGGFGTTPTRTGNTFTGRDGTNSYGLKNMQIYGIFNATPSSATTSTSGLVANFAANPTGPNGETIIELKVATSFMSTSQAQKNLQLEIDDNEWFDAVMAKSKTIWNKVFASTAINDPTANYWDLVDFYSKYARTCMYPTILHENTQTGTIAEARANPRWQYVSPYRGSTSNLVIRDGYLAYNEGFWDTFRSKWTALIFFRPSDVGKLFDGIVSHFTDQDSRGSFGIPRWIKPAGQNLMVMTSSDVIATELYARNVNYNYKVGYDASLKSSTAYGPTSGTQGGRFGIQTSIFYGYTPWGAAPAAGGGGQLDASWAIEGFVNDAGTAKMAKGLRDEAIAAGNTELARSYNDEYLYFENRAKYYRNLFNPTNAGSVSSPGWLMNRNTSGQWLGGNGSTSTAFNALDWGWGFCEDNAYQYVVSVPQDGRGLANLFGGKEAFGTKLEHIFSNSSWDGVAIRGGGYGGAIHEAYEKREVKIGQWGLSNEPGEHMQSMWLFSDKPENAAKYTRMGMQQAGGSIQVGRGMMGEEDNGSMASWWVWAYIGLYPLDNGSGNIVVGSPRFKEVTFNLDDGRNFVFLAPNAGPQNCYVNGIKFNGEPYDKLYFTQDMFQDGNVFEFDMGATPSGWARTAEPPPSLTEGEGYEHIPSILMDIIPVGATAVANQTLPEVNSVTQQLNVTGITAANAAYLRDNSSVTSEATFTGNTGTITYTSAVPVKVEMYTLTSSNTDGADPKTWTLSGSNDGTTWKTLDSRNLPNITTYANSAVTTAADAATKTSETFRWRRQTKPFAIAPENQGEYKYYRLQITASSSNTAMRLSQFELLAELPDWNAAPSISKSGNNVTVSASITNNTMQAGTVNVFAAIYSADGKMIDVGSRLTNSIAPVSTTASLPSNIVLNAANAGDGYYVKVFIWDPTTYIPKTPAFILS